MIIAARRKEILGILREKGSIDIKESALHFGVSEMTIRRDLDWLYSSGMITRVHGGAVQNNFLVSREIESYGKRQTENSEKKKAIAKGAIDMVVEGSTIYLDGGTTCGEIASALPRSIKLKIITDNISIHRMLLDNINFEVILIGGTVAEDQNTLDGYLALEVAKLLTCDIAFISSASADLVGVMNTSTIGISVKKEMMKNSIRNVFVCDSSKIGSHSIYRYASWNDIDCMITDNKADDDFLEKVKEINPNMIIKKVQVEEIK